MLSDRTPCCGAKCNGAIAQDLNSDYSTHNTPARGLHCRWSALHWPFLEPKHSQA